MATERYTTHHLNKRAHPTPLPLDDDVPEFIDFRVADTDRVVTVKVRGALVVGRSDHKLGLYADIDLSPFDARGKGVSRQHALILAHHNRLTIQDLRSVNGTYLNDYSLEPRREYHLRHGDHLIFGDLQLQIMFVEPAESTMNDPDQPLQTEIPRLEHATGEIPLT